VGSLAEGEQSRFLLLCGVLIWCVLGVFPPHAQKLCCAEAGDAHTEGIKYCSVLSDLPSQRLVQTVAEDARVFTLTHLLTSLSKVYISKESEQKRRETCNSCT
jgi:hypothetical protein